MQKVYSLALIFLAFLFGFNYFAVKSWAVEGMSASPSSQSENEIRYELPYPGLLPDSPLYFLRIIRDKTVSFLISDSLKKAEFNLLQADKRLNAGIYLFDKGNVSLSLSTISKAENYFSQAIDKMEEAKKQGRDIKDIKEKLKNAFKKHEQELKILTEKADKNFKSGFEKELKRVTVFGERLGQ